MVKFLTLRQDLCEDEEVEVGYLMLSKSILVYEQCRHAGFSGLLLLIVKLATSSSRLLSIGA